MELCGNIAIIIGLTAQFVHGWYAETGRVHLVGENASYADQMDNQVVPNKRRTKRSLQRPFFGGDHVRVVELLVVVDKTLITNYGGDYRRIEQKCLTMLSHVNYLYSQFAVRISIIDFLYWSNGDWITVSNDADSTLEQFNAYRKEHLMEKKFDHAMLLSGNQFSEMGGGIILGRAYIYSICGMNPVSIISYNNDEKKLAWTISHELGHGFGMRHDNETCQCDSGEVCIMGTHFSGFSGWSSCSRVVMDEFRRKGFDSCLRNLPVSPYQECGNNILESGEQCDCGLPAYCSNPCCNATTCLLKEHAECSDGECCDVKSCKVKGRSVECRKKKEECDVAEYCDGKSEFCPVDRFELDGMECGRGEGYCLKGSCPPSRAKQCQKIWGKDFSRVNTDCYHANNETAVASFKRPLGYCSYAYDSSRKVLVYQPCSDEDIMCGVLFCSTDKEGSTASAAVSREESWRFTINQRPGEVKSYCRGVRTAGSPDYGLVRDGTKCGKDKMCFNHRCIDVKDVPQSCYQDCFGNGKCENGYCVCNSGYEQPYCGVIKTGLSGLAIACIIFFLVIPLCIILVACVYYQLRPYKKAPHIAWVKEKRDFLITSINQQLSNFSRSIRRQPAAAARKESRSATKQKRISSVALIPAEPVEENAATTNARTGQQSKEQYVPLALASRGQGRIGNPVRPPPLTTSGQDRRIIVTGPLNSGQTRMVNIVRPLNRPGSAQENTLGIERELKNPTTSVQVPPVPQTEPRRKVEVSKLPPTGIDRGELQMPKPWSDGPSVNVSALGRKFLK